MRWSRLLATGLFLLVLATAGCLAGSEDRTTPEETGLADASADSADTLPPETHLTANRTQGTAPLDLAFTLEATGNVSAWTFDPGDGPIDGEQLPATINHTYQQPGNHTANLTVDTGEEPLQENLTIHVDAAEETNATDEETEESQTEEEEQGEEEKGERVDESPNCSRFVPTPADPAGLTSEWETRTLDVAIAVDAAFANHQDDWRAVAYDHVDAMSEIYEREIALEIEPVHFVGIPDDAVAIDGTTEEAIEDLRAYYDDQYPDLQRDAVYLFSGGTYSNAAGQAACIGGAGYTDDAYAVGEATVGPTEVGPARITVERAVKIATHEIGHLLAAHHHHANCVESAPGYEPMHPAEVCTTMINFANLIEPTFSSFNELVMRGHLQAIQDEAG